MNDLDLTARWDEIRKNFSQSFFSSLHFTIASQNDDGSPIGTVFLNTDHSGFYFERFTKQLPKYAREHQQVCILAVNSSKRFWIRSLYHGRFMDHPAIRLYAELGPLRAATDSELYALRRRLRYTRRLKGYRLLWNDMNMVREFTCTRAQKMAIGSMTARL